MASTKFQPGQSGNPAGRPKGSISLTTILKQKLAEGDTAKDVIQWTLEQAKIGNAAALKILWDRIDGPIVNKVELDDISALSPEERDRRAMELLDTARARRAGSVAIVNPEEGD
jgi:hypothetical protein